MTHPLLSTDANDFTQYGTLDGLSPDFAPGFITVRDENDGQNSARVDLLGLQNVSNTTFSNELHRSFTTTSMSSQALPSV